MAMTEGFSKRTPQQALAALLERFTPQRLLLVGTRFPALDAFAQAHPGNHRHRRPRAAAG